MVVHIAITGYLTVAPLVAVQAKQECPNVILMQQLERAEDARDHLFFWEGIDDTEAIADLLRYIERLEKLVNTASDGCRADRIGSEILSRAARMLQHARTIPHPPRIGLTSQFDADR
jgi:hypothetical protein